MAEAASEATTGDEQIERADGRVELRKDIVLDDPALYNEDLAPTKLEKRTWSTYTYAALWISMAHCIPTYMLAAGLISAGMSWRQALVTILIGNVIVLLPILANSHPGTKYGIPFPVFARASYGVFGANVPAIMRAIVACGWFGINAWIGGQALQTFFRSLWPGWQTLLGPMSSSESWVFGGHYPTEWVSFLLFWGLNILIVYKGMELVRKVENLAAPYVLVMTALLVVWAIMKAKATCEGKAGCSGLGEIMSSEGKFTTLGEFWPVFVPSVTAMIGFWSTLSLNMPDFTRFGRSQKEQAVGQVVALPTTMTVFADDGHHDHERVGGDLRRGDLGSRGPRRSLREPAARRGRDVHRRRGHARREHRCERRLAGERFRQHQARRRSASRPAVSSPASSAS